MADEGIAQVPGGIDVSVVSRRQLLSALTLLALAGCGEQAAQHERGTATRPPSQRPTVISLVPAVTELLFAIGAGPQVIAVSSFDRWPAEVESLPKVGALLDPDIERILRLRPDVLVLHVSQQELRQQVERIGIRTFAHATGGLGDVAKTMRALGALVGRSAEGEAAAAAFERRMREIGDRAAGRPRPRTLLVFGREPGALRAIDASGGVGFLHDVLTLVGGENVFASVRRESVRVSTEAILAAAPEVIIDLRYDKALPPAELERERRVWDALGAVPAVRDGRVHVLVGDKFVIPGPRLVDAAEDLQAALETVP
jgi:iron complex transport system substrate-binding protein